METEVIRLLKQIEMEYEAAYRGINGFSVGVSRHDFINARMENIDRYRVELTELVGDKEAVRLIRSRLSARSLNRRSSTCTIVESCMTVPGS